MGQGSNQQTSSNINKHHVFPGAPRSGFCPAASTGWPLKMTHREAVCYRGFTLVWESALEKRAAGQQQKHGANFNCNYISNIRGFNFNCTSFGLWFCFPLESFFWSRVSSLYFVAFPGPKPGPIGQDARLTWLRQAAAKPSASRVQVRAEKESHHSCTNGWLLVEPYPSEKNMTMSHLGLGWWLSQSIYGKKTCSNAQSNGILTVI